MKDSTGKKSKYRITVYGMVQGIGYRPYIKRLATKHGISGTVMNSGGIVIIYAQGEENRIEQFSDELRNHYPFGGRIDEILLENIDESFCIQTDNKDEFKIISSEKNNLKRSPLIPVDIATCPECERELLDPKNRRYQYPFISCVQCGPRYSIIEKLPYDRENTTMKSFTMCRSCNNEYVSVDNLKRCHAQTNACHECGPQIYATCYDKNNTELVKQTDTVQILERVTRSLLDGKIVAIKDIGGYHLACLANNANAVSEMRKVKGREAKPFAVMFVNTKSMEPYTEVSSIEKKELESIARPIVLLRKKKDFKGAVCDKSYETGCMLPCNPLQILIMEQINRILPGEPLIMTSANRSGEPIISTNIVMEQWQQQETAINIVISHDRDILTPLDDSVEHVIKDKVQVIRRSRGYVPEPIQIGNETDISYWDSEDDLYAAGGDLKSSFCLCKSNRAYLSQYLGDLENAKIEELYINTYSRMKYLFKINPNKYVTDLHPLYHSGKLAEKLVEINSEPIKVQHHFAHAASVLAENYNYIDVRNTHTLAIVFDGTGYGSDGNVWGGEFIYISDNRMNRVGHIKPVKLIGGNEGAKNSKIILYGYLANAFDSDETQMRKYIEQSDWGQMHIVNQAIKHNINIVTSTSAGRLFDAVSALTNVSLYNHYEGQSAMELETAAVREKQNCKHHKNISKIPVIWESENIVADTLDYFKDLANAVNNKQTNIAIEFHLSLANMIADVVKKVQEKIPVDQVLLSGGTFQNRILLENVIEILEEQKIKVYINEKVPSGDGGIALGQAFIAKEKIKCV